jgi:hypothetical protein
MVRHAAGHHEQALELLTVADRERQRTNIPTPVADRAALADLRRSVTERLLDRAEGPESAGPSRDLERLLAALRGET